ncbi:protein O-GlcNAcase isoform X1 [Oncorhynchus mykiss]|uniref:protein O-GlcNAcase isoform X1 n=1 Tax=Oncorhynchus mykiss TaxID=8022 RepID=UPI001878CB78|nr:protein O-GlcNAcase isoform X1 [Oncorhynchus mykiss]
MPKPSASKATGKTRRFISGVVEGFYGRPWTMEQRTELFQREKKWGLNTYLYAPKDDYKHRMYWRDLYSPEEAEKLVALITAAKKNGVDFIYAISPGLDITFSNPKEVATLKRKLDQVSGFGCSSFSLLFDDIETEMCPADKQAFSSFAHAQVAVTNEVFTHLGQPDTFLFCPTDYCAAFCTPNVSQSAYLHTVGENLLPGIDVLWTGPKVVSHHITVESIVEVSSVLKRAPVIWDNIHANDYDPQRIFMGPYKDRPTDLIPKLRGVLTNPNCEYHPNFVAIHTLATWCRSEGGRVGGQRDVEMTGGDDDEAGSDPCYSPKRALTLALTDWLQEFLSTDQPGGPRPLNPTHLKKESSDEEPMQTDVGDPVYVPSSGDNPLFTAEPLTLDDLQLLSELFYLPYEHGSTARTMLTELDWLKAHREAVGDAETEMVRSVCVGTEMTAEWRSRAKCFDVMCVAVFTMFNRLSNAPNRSILYDLYNYICDIKSGVTLARAYVKQLGGQSRPSAQVMTDDPEPWGFRGGLSGEFQRMLPCHGNRDLFRHPPMTSVYSIRPFCPEDKTEIQKIHMEMQRGEAKAPAAAGPVLISDGLAGGQLSPSPNCGLVLEDERGVCGYALGLTDATAAALNNQRTLPGDFPSLVTMQLHPRVTDPAPARRMIGSLLSLMKTSGSRGVFCELRQGDRRMFDFYSKLGSFTTLKMAGWPQDVVAMGTSL